MCWLGVRDPNNPWLFRARRLRRRLLQTDNRIRNDYLRNNEEPKLHIGGGWRLLDGWLNGDIELVPGVMFMDATQRFPLADESFQLVFTEHMIEHIPYEKAEFMLRDCYRVMRKGGVIRVATPDFAAIVGLYREDLSDIQRRYLSWFSETFLPRNHRCSAVSSINAHFRLWGHQFIYDEETLGNALCAAGFTSVQRRRLGESEHAALKDLEHTQRYPEGLLDFESMALEAYK